MTRDDLADWLNGLPPAASDVVLIGGGARAVRTVLSATRVVGRVLLWEPDAAVGAALLNAPEWAAAHAAGRLTVVAGPEPAGLSEVAKSWAAVSSAPVFVDPELSAKHPGLAKQAKEGLARLAFQASANAGARKASAGRYLLQTLGNAPRLTREAPVDLLTGLIDKGPAIVVAAGPSLDRNIDDLALVADRGVIIACDTAALPLINRGIEPDFIVATDASRANAAHLSALPHSPAWLVAEGSLHGSSFVHFDQRTFYFRVANHEPWAWLRQAGLDCATLDTWGSVATSALSLALALGAGSVVFLGADFAFTGDRPYCRGTSMESKWASWNGGGTPYESLWTQAIERWPMVTVTDVAGRPVRTAPHLVSFRDWLVDRVQARPDCRFINGTGAGLLVGPGLVQQNIVHALADCPLIDKAGLHAEVRTRHLQSRRELVHLLAATTMLLTGGDDEVIDQWLTFADGSLNRAAIEASLRCPEFLGWTAALAFSAALRAPADPPHALSSGKDLP